MKPSRRVDSDSVRRDSRDRDVSHASGSSRFGRKRPSMLSEFHGSKHHSHNPRDGDRESSSNIQHYRPHSRYSHDTPSVGSGPTSSSTADHTHSLAPSGFHSSKSSKTESRSRHSRHHAPHRSASHHHHSNSHHHTNFTDTTASSMTTPEDEAPVKRPRLMVDISRKLSGHSDTPSSADSVNSVLQGRHSMEMASPWMSYHLEDIDSDDDDSLLREEYDKKRSKSPTPIPTGSPVAPPPTSPTPVPPSSANSDPPRPPKVGVGGSPMPSKEELLVMMEKVDRDIAAAETQISVLEKKRAELEESARATAAGTPRSSTFSSLPSPATPPSDHASALAGGLMGEDTPLPSPSPPGRLTPKKSLLEVIYSENRTKSKSAQSSLSSASFSPQSSLTALYHQPCEAPPYYQNLYSHQAFRPKLVQHIRRRKLSKHKKEMQLCQEYDTQMARWERSVERIESNPKKKLRDQKNRELFERCFPELKAKREHQERLTRVDQRGYGIVRSDAELKEIMYELCEQEEAPVRYRKTHAVIPPMLVEDSERRVQFSSSNGLISDPMALHRDSRFISAWSEEEKTLFRDKYMFYPKNFEVISTFLPNKSPADCIQHYYLSKKREKYKHMVRKANLKRKKPFVKPSEFPNPPLTPSAIAPPLPLSLFTAAKPKPEDSMSAEEDNDTHQSEFGDWSPEEISSLKEGLRKYGRAWGKIYREVGGMKTATQCKQFYDKYCGNKQLDLSVALAEHSSMKSAEKLRRRVENRKPVQTASMSADLKRKSHQKPSLGGSVSSSGGGGGGSNKPSPLHHLHTGSEEMDSENTASVYDSDSNSEDSSSESTITDSSPEDASSNSTFAPPSSQPQKPQRGKKPKPLSTSGFRRTSEEALDLFISAAEALNNIVPPEVALHDHSYAMAPSALVNNMELQGTSGLSLIAAAAAVVSPTLSKSAGSAKVPSLSPVRAPRGRPPNSQRKGANSTTSKLAPTLLSPAGTSPSVLLTEMKTTPLRGRTRSAPSDRPKVSTFVPRPGSTLARMSINSASRTVGNRSGGGASGLAMPPASYARHKGYVDTTITSSSSGNRSTSSSSLKSMIAYHTSSSSPSQGHTPSPPTSAGNGKSSGTSSTSAFEALVNVAVAAPPAELPHSGISAGGNHSKSSSPVSTPAFTATPLSRSHSHPHNPHHMSSSSKETVTIGVAGSNSNASNSGSTTTAYIDVNLNQAINILASLAQQQVSSAATNGGSPSLSVLPNSRGLFQQNLLGNIMSQGSKSFSNSGGLNSAPTSSSALTTSKGGKGLGVSATVDTLLGHLTSGMTSQAVGGAKKASGVSSGGQGSKVKQNLTSKGDLKSGGVGGKPAGSGSGSKVASQGGVPATHHQSIQLMGSVDDLSNLNLLSSLVAAVAASQSATLTSSSSVPPTSTASLETTPISTQKSSVGQSSSSFKIEGKRVLETVVSALSGGGSVNSSSPSQSDNASISSSYVSSHTSTPSDDGLSTPGSITDVKQERDQPPPEKMIAATSSIKKPSLQSSSSGGSVYAGGAVSMGGGGSGGGGELPRSVVRSGLGVGIADQNNVSPSGNDLSASLASLIPPYNPSSQSSLLLYTRSLSFPLAVSSELPNEEEDHLESATRGISELSKLLGTDSGTDASAANSNSTRHDHVYKGLSNWNPSELLTNSSSGKSVCPDFSSGLQDKAGKPAYLSSLLESQIHGTVHHTKLSSPSTNSSRGETMEAPLDIDHSR